jgi:hypothetical protein
VWIWILKQSFDIGDGTMFLDTLDYSRFMKHGQYPIYIFIHMPIINYDTITPDNIEEFNKFICSLNLSLSARNIC